MKRIALGLLMVLIVMGIAACQVTTATTQSTSTTTTTTTNTTTSQTSTTTTSTTSTTATTPTTTTTTTTTTAAPTTTTTTVTTTTEAKVMVYFAPNNGATMTPLELVPGSLIPEPADPVRDGYVFLGWYRNSTHTILWNFAVDTVTQAMTLYAKWEYVPKTVTVSFSTDGGSPIDSVNVVENSTFDRPADPVKSGKVFAGWYLNPELTEVWDFGMDTVSGAMTLYAKWIDETNFNQTFKILSIGNSFSEDAHKFLWSIAQSYGIAPENIIIANLYIGGSSLANHVANIGTDAAAYQYQLFTSSSVVTTNGVSISQALAYQAWDVITFQQASHDSGMPLSYGTHIETLTEYVLARATNPNVQLYWHMTWAYQQTSTHSGFANYGNDQATMFNAILSTVDARVKPVSQLFGIIPAGTAIQNARTSYKGDLFTRDGYHLSDPFGRYIAGLMFFKQITGFEVSPATIAFRPAGLTANEQLLAMEAVNAAFLSPGVITPSTFTVEPDPEPVNVTGVPYVFEYVQGFWADNATAVSPTTDALHNSFAAVLPIPKYLLPVGSEIVLAPGYQYRVIFFEKTGETYRVVYRTALYQIDYLILDEAFWGNYDYIGFNVTTNPTAPINTRLDEVAGKLKLYHPEGTGEGHVDTELTWSNGKYMIGESGIVASVNHLATNPLTPAYYDLDTVFEVAAGYKFAVVVLNYDGGAYTVVSISDYQIDPLSIDPVFAEGKELLAFIVTTTNEDVAIAPADAASAVSMHPHVIPHVDREIGFISGYWELSKSAITTTNANMTFLNGFAASQPQSKAYYANITSITVAAGYQVRVIYLTYDNYGKYTVGLRSNNLTGTIVLDEVFWGAYEYVAFNISSVPSSDLSGNLGKLPSKLSYNQNPMTYSLGYWDTNKTALTASTTFAGSNVVARQFIPAGTILNVEAGYQVRVIFLNKDGEGFKVAARSENFVGQFVLTSGLYQNYQYIAFNISTVPSSNLTAQVDTLATRLTFTPFTAELVAHEDQPLTFVSGYWNNFAQAVTPGIDTFSKGFAASSVLSKASFDGTKEIVIAAGYQVRVIYFDYSFNTYQVLFRTANLTGTIVLDEAFWGQYQYVGFNISTVPSTDLSTVLETLPPKLTFVPVDTVE